MQLFSNAGFRTFFAVLTIVGIFGSGYVIGAQHPGMFGRTVAGSEYLSSDGTPLTLIDESEKTAALYPVKGLIKVNDKNAPADFQQFWKAWNEIHTKYYPVKGKEIDDQQLVWGSIGGLAKSLDDPYTFFMPPKEAAIFNEDVSGSFGGVGMQVGIKDKQAVVIAPLKNTPAERAGIRKGDKIIAVDGATTTDMALDAIIGKIRGKVGTKVVLTMQHEDVVDPYVVTIIREQIQSPVVETDRKNGVFIIRLFEFTQTSGQLMAKAIGEYKASGLNKLVIDVRGNPGGYLDSAVDISSWFLNDGDVVVTERGKEYVNVHRASRGGHGEKPMGGKSHVVLLVDGGSASASEILAGALRDHKSATLIGSKTFGKGSVQELIDITPETSLKLTVARWVMPNGQFLTEGGIEPDIKIDLTKEDAKAARDPQLDRAIEFLNYGK
jgi:carboxyl-terminal processing protease